MPTAIAMWLLLSLYAVARLFQILPGRLPMTAVVALHVLPLLAFALIHGSMSYRPRVSTPVPKEPG
jgi:hypothetical protein